MKELDLSKLLVWLSVPVFAMHNLEEAMGMEMWAEQVLSSDVASLYKTLPFSLAVTILWIAYLSIVLWHTRRPSRVSTLIFLLVFSALFSNGIFHVLANALGGQSIPGFYSAVFLVIPLGCFLLFHAYSAQWLRRSLLGPVVLTGAILQIPVAALAIYVSNHMLRI